MSIDGSKFRDPIGQVGDGGEAPSNQPPKPSQLPPSLTNLELGETIELRVNGKTIISTAARSVDLRPAGIAKLLKEMAAILEAPDEEDKEFF